MGLPRGDRVVQLALVVALATACGARGGLDFSDLEGAPADAAVVDAGGRDAARPRDSGTTRGDAGRMDGGSRRCAAGERFEITRRRARLDWPALARVGDRALLVFTQQGADGSVGLVAQPITPTGTVTRPPMDVALGSGGTLVPRWIEDVAPGFTVSFRTPEGQLSGARFHVDGSMDSVATAGFGMTDSRRPGLLLTERLAVNAWNAVGELAARGFASDLRDRTMGTLVLGGQQDPVLASSARDDTFLLATHDGRVGRIAEHDASGAVIAERMIDPGDGRFPFGTGGAIVVEGAPDAAVVWGGVIRALETFTVYAELGEHTASWTRENDFIWDAAAAFDSPAGRLGIAAAIRHDEGISRMPTPHVFFYVLDRADVTQEIVLAGPLFESEPRDLHVATVDTGIDATPFLTVWTESEGEDGVVAGALVICP